MKIHLLTQRLEVGKCGVGDYTLRVARELSRQGHDVTAVGFDDEYVAEPTTTHDGGVTVTRFPQGRPETWGPRLTKDDVDGYLLQMTPWQLGPRGISQSTTTAALVQRLVSLHGAIFLHELWTGAFAGSPLREVILGRLQRRNLRDVIEQCQPQAVVTSNNTYRHLAEAALGRSVSVVPLPGAVEVVRRATPASSSERGVVRAVLFGNVPAEWPAEDCFNALSALGAQLGSTVVLTVVNPRADGSERFDVTLPHLEVKRTGCLEPAALSELLSGQHLGLVGVPAVLAGKSSSLATLREHRVPVWIARDDVHARRGTKERHTETREPGILVSRHVSPESIIRLMSESRELNSGVDIAAIARQLALASTG